jgi:hypothetical protein
MAILTNIIEAVAIRLTADEAKSWLPWLNSKLLSLAVSRLPCDQRERFREEWAADLESFPSGIARTVRACGMVWAGWIIGGSIPTKMRAYAAQLTLLLMEFGVYCLGLIVLGGALATIWWKFQPLTRMNLTFCLGLGVVFGLLDSCLCLAFIVRARKKAGAPYDIDTRHST